VADPPDSQPVREAPLGAPGLLGRIRRLSPWRFVLVVSMILVAAKLIQLPFWMLVLHYCQTSGLVSPAQPGEDPAWARSFFVLVLVAPWVETLLGQALWMVLTSHRSRPTLGYVIPATIWFCFLHGAGSWPGWSSLDWWLKVLPHAVSSFILACTFQHGWKHSWWRGIWMTSVVHQVGNLPAWIILRFLPSGL
jgi:hypothetical protein